VRFSAYDGSTAGSKDAKLGLRIVSPRGVSYLATAPGSLGMARAYIKGDLEIEGAHPGNPYEMLKLIDDDLRINRPPMTQAVEWARQLGARTFVPPPLPEQEVVPTWRRGIRHSRERDASSISYHYDVSNTFYEHVLGPSMTYTCACYPTADATLEQAQEHKYDLVAKKLDLKPGMRLLDVACGWGGIDVGSLSEQLPVPTRDHGSRDLVAALWRRTDGCRGTFGASYPCDGRGLPCSRSRRAGRQCSVPHEFRDGCGVWGTASWFRLVHSETAWGIAS